MNIKNIVGAASLAIACSLGVTTNTSAAPIAHNPIASPATDLVTEVGGKIRIGFYQRHGIFYYNGHRGYKHHRYGYRKFRGHYFPRHAFTARIYIGPRYVRPHYVRPGYVRPRHTRPSIHYVTQRHVQWCYAKYRSYRAHDDTFQPYHGPRRHCRSPYKR